MSRVTPAARRETFIANTLYFIVSATFIFLLMRLRYRPLRCRQPPPAMRCLLIAAAAAILPMPFELPPAI